MISRQSVQRRDARLSDMTDQAQLWTTFDEDAELYDRMRPGYPSGLYTDLVELTGVGTTSRVLEIGSGTGQATLPLARLAGTVVGLEPGANLAAVARRNLAERPNASIVEATFEEWPLPNEPFDLVVSATAFHWVDPDVRMVKAAQALIPGGALAVVSTHHVEGGTWSADSTFNADIQACYERFDPATPPNLQMPTADDIHDDPRELDESGKFTRPTFRRYEWERTYTTAEYLDLLMTYSGHRALPRSQRNALLECIAHLIRAEHGGSVTKRYLTRLSLAKTGRS